MSFQTLMITYHFTTNASNTIKIQTHQITKIEDIITKLQIQPNNYKLKSFIINHNNLYIKINACNITIKAFIKQINVLYQHQIDIDDFVSLFKKFSNETFSLKESSKFDIYENINEYIHRNLPRNPFDWLDRTDDPTPKLKQHPKTCYYNIQNIKEHLKHANNTIILKNNKYIVF